MFTVIRTLVAQPGKMHALVVCLKDLAEYNHKIIGRHETIATSVGGNFAEVSYIWQLESLTEMDTDLAKLHADRGYHEKQSKVGALIMGGMSREHIYRHA
jgi:hypothetical protein